MRFHGVRPLSLWVLIALSPGEIRGRVLKVKSYGSTTTICVSCFKVIERAVQHDEGGGGPILGCPISGKTLYL